MIGPTELMVVMIIMLVVVIMGGNGKGPRPPSMRRLQSHLGNRRPLLGFGHSFDGVGACARTPFCYPTKLERARCLPTGAMLPFLALAYEIQDTSPSFEVFDVY